MKSTLERQAPEGANESRAVHETAVKTLISERSDRRRLWIAGLGAAVVVAVFAMTMLRADDGPATRSPAQHDAALRSAIELLMASDGVQGLEEGYADGRLASAMWFDYRRSGDTVAIQREELINGQIAATIQVRVGDALYQASYTGEPSGEWEVVEPYDGPLAFGLALLLDYERLGFSSEGGEVTFEEVSGGGRWTVTAPFADGQQVVTWATGQGGELRSYAYELVGVDPANVPFPGLTSATIAFTALEDPVPIAAPDIDTVPNPETFGLPADFPFGSH